VFSEERLVRIERKLNLVLAAVSALIKEEHVMSDTVQNEINQLTASVTQETTVENSAIALINGIPALIQTAVNTALAEGATPAQLAALSALNANLLTEAQNLGNAVTANTPAAQSSTGTSTTGSSTATVTGGAS
jgi:hypothetical protein